MLLKVHFIPYPFHNYSSKNGKLWISRRIHVPGKVISVIIKWQVLNVYTPADTTLQEAFYSSLPNPPPHLSDRSLIAGDWNCLPSSLDKVGGSSELANPCPDSLMQYTALNNLVDIWRHQHPTDRETTCQSIRRFQGDNALNESRIDRWLLSDALKNRSDSHVIHTMLNFQSDHSPVALIINPLVQVERGKGYWMLNTSILTNEEYRKEIEVFLNHAPARLTSFESRLQWWDWIKKRIKLISIAHCTRIQKRRKEEEAKLTEALLSSRKEWIRSPHGEICKNDYLQAKKNLSALQTAALEGAKIRSRIR